MTDDFDALPHAEQVSRLRAALETSEANNRELRRRVTPETTGPVIRRSAEVPTFYQEDLTDSTFFAAHRDEILKAASLGRIVPKAGAGINEAYHREAQAAAREAARQIGREKGIR